MASPKRRPIPVLPLKISRPLVVLDLETTGRTVAAHRIVEIGILKVMPNGEEVRFRERVRPPGRIPKGASDLHGITKEKLANKLPFRSIAGKVHDLIRGCDLAGFNIKKFDLPMLKFEFRRAGIEFSAKGIHVIDVMHIYHFHKQPTSDGTLKAAVKTYRGRTYRRAHSALSDACDTWAVLQGLIKKHGLPESVKDLAGLIKFMDSDYWFCKQNGKAVFAKFKYTGQRLSRIVALDPGFLAWMLRTPDIATDTKRIIKEEMRKSTKGRQR